MRFTPSLTSMLIAATVAVTLAQEVREIGLPAYAGRAELVSDLRARRARAASALGKDTVLVLWSAPPRVYSDDTNYQYRQESNLLYLTGLSRENVVLVLAPGTSAREFLFIPAGDPTQELWTGHIPTVEEVRAATGVEHVFAQQRTEALDAFLAGLLGRSGSSGGGVALEQAAAHGSELSATMGGALQFALLDYGQPDAESVEATRLGAWTRQQRERGGTRPFTFVDGGSALRAQRQIKTAYEQKVLRRSVEISAEAHIEGMKAARPGRWEYEVEAAIEYWFLKNGALSPGYASIAGSGPNATYLHLLESTRRMQAGDLLLVDAAGNFQGLTGDITRTYPVSGRFTAEQRALYDLVLTAQQAGIAAAKPGVRAADINRAIRQAFGPGLMALGLVTDPAAKNGEGAQIGMWFPHSAVHGIGVDVHDPLGRLDPGAAFVIEPGLYIRQDTFDRLARDPAQAEAARAIRPAFEKFRNMGIRIEDSFLMTSSGALNLSDKAPRAAADIEKIVGTGRD